MLNIDNYLDTKLIEIVEHILDNPSVMHDNSRSFSVSEILKDDTLKFQLQSQHLFAFMSSAFSPSRQEREEFLKQFPETKEFMNTLGPNRKQYAMVLFRILRKFDPLVIQIVRSKIFKIVEEESFGDIIDIYETNDPFRYRKAIYLASPDFIKAKIIIIDQDPKIQNLRHYKDD